MQEFANSKENVENEDIRSVDVPRFNLQTDKDAMLAYLEENGYVVVADVLNQDNVLHGKTLFWEFIKNRYEDIDLKDASTWKRWPGDIKTGIISGEFNHSEFLWYSRLNENVRKVFELIWDTDELLTSFDGGNAFRPWHTGHRQFKTQGGWWHVDQNCLRGPEREGRVSVQGLVTFYDADETTGGFAVVPGSHKFHEIVCRQAPRKNDFVPILGEFPSEISSFPHLLPRVKAGDMILWDSRTVHCNVPALVTPPISETISPDQNIELLRLVSYICMQPKRMASEKAIETKRIALLLKIPTSHWATSEIDPDLLQFFIETYGSNMHKILQGENEEKLRLSGFSEEEIKTRRLPGYSQGLLDSCTIV